MNLLNAALTALADGLLTPLGSGPTWLPLVLVAAASGVLMAVVFRYTSPQKALRRDAELMQAQLLAMKLFKDDVGTLLLSFGRLLGYVALRLWHSLPPVLVMLVPFVLLLVQLARWYEYAPLVPGGQAVVELQVSPGDWTQWQRATLEPNEVMAIETPAMRDPAEHAIYWRVRAQQPGSATLRWSLGDQSVEKRLTVAERANELAAVDMRRPGSGWLDRLLHPGEPGFRYDSPVRGIDVRCSGRTTPVFGLDVPWWLTFFIVSMLAAVLMRPVVKVQF